MNPLSNAVVEASYQHCARLSRRAASNFYWSFWLLPARKRKAMYALYAFARHTDDLADGESADSELVTSSLADSEELLEKRRNSVARWREELQRALDGRTDDPILPALADTARRFEVPHRYLFEIIDGVSMDLAPNRFQTWSDLQRYCHRVATAVGIACVYIWGHSGSNFMRPAEACGLAFQLTNILRDLKEDSERGRCYLPIEDFDNAAYSPEELRRGIVDDRFYELLRSQIQRAEQLYCDARPLADMLHRDGRRTFQLMFATYWRLLKEIEQRPDDVMKTRIRLSRGQKLRLIIANMAGRGLPRIPSMSAANADAALSPHFSAASTSSEAQTIRRG